MFRKILIANRGEIAVRVARTARRIGIRTVAVFSDADAGAPHVAACDEAVRIGPSPAAESYLRADKIIKAARATGAEAVHPGYGFLSENAGFAEALDKAGLVFIGPTAETIRAMGSKSAAKDLMEAAGVPTTPGYQGEDQTVETFASEAERIGYPVLLKATAGGGGKGMRVVERAEDLAEALASAQREAKSAFGDDRFLVEKYVAEARHLEVQIFGDGRGEVVHLFERDCSVQRRHQKIIEEAPAPSLPAKVRNDLLTAGVEAGKAVAYRGAGTVEFLYDPAAKAVYFMEMNTRLQVEHPVTEMITGVDLVEWQLRVAAGEALPATQSDITSCGHAFEARLYAEDPGRDFAPAIGRLDRLDLPEERARIDSGVVAGQEITPHYDPMIAKIITAGGTRAEALGRLAGALEATRVTGLETNAGFLHALATDTDFAAGEVSTRYIERHAATLFAAPAPGPIIWAAAALAARAEAETPGAHDPWVTATGFRLNRRAKSVHWIAMDDTPALVRVLGAGPDYEIEIQPGATAARRRTGEAEGEVLRIACAAQVEEPGRFAIEIDGVRERLDVSAHAAGFRVWRGGRFWDVARPAPLSGEAGGQSAEGSLTAPMPGVLTKVLVAPGDAVGAGDALAVMEAMKMEHAIKAPRDGVVAAVRFGAGDQVKEGDLLVEFQAEDDEG